MSRRDAVRASLLARAEADPRVVAAAWVGGSAGGERDRWSDLDFALGVTEDIRDEWTAALAAEHDALHLFDLGWYRVFLLPGGLQVDVSFTPAAEFGRRGPRFELLFGEAIEHPPAPPPDAADLFGRAAHHVVRAHVCIERGKLWQAEFWLSLARDHALELACLRHGLDPSYGRGFDELPASVLDPMQAAIPAVLDRAELRRALRVLTGALEGDDAVVARLRELAQ
jgi:hypothetical protein